MRNLFSLFQNRRAEQLESLAREVKMEFSRKDSMGLIKYLKDFKLFTKGQNRRISNILRRTETSSDLKTYVFDYRYTVSSGNSSQRLRQTVFFIQTKELGLPRFYMRPEHFFHRIGAWFGIEDINFEMDPEFSEKYYLTGNEPEIIRDTFTAPVRAFFRVNKKWHVEGLNYFLIAYRPKELIVPDQIKVFYEKGLEIFELIREEGFNV